MIGQFVSVSHGTLVQALLISTVSTGQLQPSLLSCLQLQGKKWVPFPDEVALEEAASVLLRFFSKVFRLTPALPN